VFLYHCLDKIISNGPERNGTNWRKGKKCMVWNKPYFWDGEIVDNNLQIDKAAKNSYSTFVNLQNMLVTSITFELFALYLFGPTKKVLSALILVCFIREA